MSHFLFNVLFKHTCSDVVNVQTHKYRVLQVTELATVKHPSDRFRALQSWQREGGVMLIGYEMYRILSLAQKISDEVSKKEMKSILLDPGTVAL